MSLFLGVREGRGSRIAADIRHKGKISISRAATTTEVCETETVNSTVRIVIIASDTRGSIRSPLNHSHRVGCIRKDIAAIKAETNMRVRGGSRADKRIDILCQIVTCSSGLRCRVVAWRGEIVIDSSGWVR